MEEQQQEEEASLQDTLLVWEEQEEQEESGTVRRTFRKSINPFHFYQRLNIQLLCF